MVSLVKNVTKQKCGHLGTLDPLASGVLPVAVGKATKLFDWFLHKDKRYFAMGIFGVESTTLDSDGEIIQQQEVDIKQEQIDEIIDEFKGEIEQIPPRYSSISINGNRAYDLARNGEDFELPARKVNIFELECIGQLDKNLFAFDIHCSTGTYVRSLISDIAKRLNTVAITACIIRTASGPFTLGMSYTPEQVKNNQAKMVEIDKVINLPHLIVNNEVCARLLNGQTINARHKNGNYLCYCENKLLGIAKVDKFKLKIDINLWEETND